MSKEQFPFTVPTELHDQVNERALDAHERYARLGLSVVKHAMGNVGESQAVLIGGAEGDPEAGINVLALPHQQAWKPSMAIRSWIYHDITNPDGVTVVLPNSSVINKSYTFSDKERELIHKGNMRPFYEKQTSAVETVVSRYGRRGDVSLGGYSLGGLTSLGIASVGSDELNVKSVHSIEAPNKQSTPKELQKDFMKSGGIGKQLNAIKDSNLPVLSDALRADRLALDYAGFGIASVANKDNKALAHAMANPWYVSLVEQALENYPEAEITAGHIYGSRLFEPSVVEYIRDPRFKVHFYDQGPGSQAHATGDNPMAHALMLSR